MSIETFLDKARRMASACGLDDLKLGPTTINLSAIRHAAARTASVEGVRDIGAVALNVFVAESAVDVALEGVGVDLLHGTLYDLIVAFADHGAALANHASMAAEVATTAADLSDSAMHVATGGLTLLASVAASYFVGKVITAEQDKRQLHLQEISTELVRRQAYQFLRRALFTPASSPQALAEPMIYMLKAGDLPTELA